jgi:hypothetical protein
MDKCGPLDNKQCNQKESIAEIYSEKNVFLDVPFVGYEEREEILREVLAICGLNGVIVKDKLTSNVMLCKVCKHISACNYGIADISFSRHSVSYELGLMHGFGKKVCILLEKTADKFSDIAGLDHTEYSGQRDFRIKLARWILENVPEAKKEATENFIVEQEKYLKEKGETVFKKKFLMPDELDKEKEISKKYSNERFAEIKSGIGKEKKFILSATPIPLREEIIDTDDEVLRKLFLHPENERSSGWNMLFGYECKPSFGGIEKGLNSGDKVLKLLHNGYLEFTALVNESFSWGIHDTNEASPRFNVYGVLEYPVSFIRLLKAISERFGLPKAYWIRMVYLNCGEFRLRPYSMKSVGHMFGDDEHKTNLDNWDYLKYIEEFKQNGDSEAFSLIKAFYNKFSFDAKHIPYFDSSFVFKIEGK